MEEGYIKMYPDGEKWVMKPRPSKGDTKDHVLANRIEKLESSLTSLGKRLREGDDHDYDDGTAIHANAIFGSKKRVAFEDDDEGGLRIVKKKGTTSQ